MAPEIYKKQPQEKTVDWWAVGILTFELITGYPPFGDNAHKICNGMYICLNSFRQP
jgi:serine/threonine protein kinase